MDNEMQKMPKNGKTLHKGSRQRGATIIEYSLLLGLISVVALSAVSLTGNSARELLDNSLDAIQTAFNNGDAESDDGTPGNSCGTGNASFCEN